MTALRFYGSYRAILLYGRRSGLPLPWHERESYPNFVKCYDVFIVAYLIYKIVCTTYSIVSIEKFEVRVYLMSAWFYFLYGLILVVFFYLKGEKYGRLVQKVDRLTEMVLTCGLGQVQHFTERYSSGAAFLRKFSIFMAFTTFCSTQMFCISVPFIDYLNDEYMTRTAVPAQCPFELQIQQIPGVFEFIVIQQGLAYTIPAFQKFVTEIIMLSLFNIQTTTFSYLTITLKQISEELEINAHDDSSLKKLNVWIKLHQYAISTFEDIIDLFSPVVIVYYLLTIVTVAGSLLYMMDASSSNIIQTFFGGSYMSMALFSLFLQCQAADEATTKAQDIANEVYNLPWYKLDKKTNSFIKLILRMITKPMYVDAYRSPAFRLSMESYQALFVNTVSAYMGFQKIKELQQSTE